MSINNSPALISVNKLSNFMFFCQKVLPLVYDDSLSYYETLCKVAHKLNEVIGSANISQENVNELKEAYDELLVYINGALNDVDNRVVNLVDTKVNEMVENGEIVIDPSLVDAAPNGYGLGGISTNIDSWNNAKDNGWYVSNTDGPTEGWWAGIVFNYNNEVIVQKVWLCEISMPLKCYQRMYESDSWGNWEDISKSAFAPAGYGLGEQPIYVDIADLDNIYQNGWYRVTVGSQVAGVHTEYADLRVDAWGENRIKQTLSLHSAYGSLLIRRKDGSSGGWQEWEWVNPPMTAGKEYRTTEQWNGKAVYTKLLDLGLSTLGAMNVYHNDLGATNMIRNNTMMNNTEGKGEVLPIIYENNFTGKYTAYVTACDANHILIMVNEGMVGRRIYTTYWYTKD